MKIIFVTLWVLNVAFSQSTVDVTFLRSVPRFNNSSFMDYYFSCRTVGRSLDWLVNGHILAFPLSHSSGSILLDFRADFVSYATLLSTSALGNSTFSYDSILLVSSAMSGIDVSPNVRCFSGAGTIKSAETTTGASNNIIKSVASVTVFLQYLFSANIVNKTLTHVYACGVSATTLRWAVTGSAHTLTFDSTQNVGENFEVLSDSNTFAALKAILISLQPYPLSSVFYVTGPEILDVRCGTDQATKMITAQQVLELPTMTPVIEATTLEPSNSTAPTNSVTTSSGDANNNVTSSSSRCDQNCVIAIVVPVTVILLILVGAGACVVRYCCCCKKTSEQRSNSPMIQIGERGVVQEIYYEETESQYCETNLEKKCAIAENYDEIEQQAIVIQENKEQEHNDE